MLELSAEKEMTHEQELHNFEMWQISVFLDELNEMLKKDMVTLIKLKHKRYRAKRGGGVRKPGQKIQFSSETDCQYRVKLGKHTRCRVWNPAYPFSPKQWYLLN
uniref:Uncharacterized protein n=1 Tax=viral metagenome TaxID=1070528 RepID=A0A6M3LDF7_9ZZZZ